MHHPQVYSRGAASWHPVLVSLFERTISNPLSELLFSHNLILSHHPSENPSASFAVCLSRLSMYQTAAMEEATRTNFVSRLPLSQLIGIHLPASLSLAHPFDDGLRVSL
jgi:hypothetical protein